MYWRTLVSILVVIVGYFLLRFRHDVLYPKFEVGFRKVAKTSEVTGPWPMKHQNFAVYALRGRRAYMEDRFKIIDDEKTGDDLFWAFGVFDGHGGSFFCEYAERHLLRAIRRRVVRANPSTLNVSQILIDEFLKLDEEGMKEGGEMWGMCGSTAVVGVLYQKKLFLANVGDGRAVARKMNGKIVETQDHKPDTPAERERIEAAGGAVVYNGAWRLAGVLAVSRAIGDGVFKKRGWLTAVPDVIVIDLNRDPIEYVIMASDGVWDVFKSWDAVEFVKPHMHEMFFGAKKLAKEALKRGSTDNICVMIVQFQERGPHRTEIWE